MFESNIIIKGKHAGYLKFLSEKTKLLGESNMKNGVNIFIWLKFNINNGSVTTTSGVTSGNTFFYSYFADYSCDPILEILKEYDIKHCYFGHIHGCYNVNGHFNYQGIDFNMISADYLDFIPLFIG